MTYLDQNVVGKGLGFANYSSVYINQSGATTAVGETLALAEAVADGPGSLVQNSHAETGTLAHVVLPPASSGITAATPAGILPHYLLVAEVAAVGAPVKCYAEAYYVDAIISGTSISTRAALFYNTTGTRNLETPGETLGLMALARYIGPNSTTYASALGKVHFKGLGFSIGAG